MQHFKLLVLLSFLHISLFAQTTESPCSHESIIQRHLELNPNFEQELEKTELQIQENIRSLNIDLAQRKTSLYTIPVVMHVFHWGDDGKMDMEQALSGLELLNQDFNGLNDGWDTIDPAFDSIKGTLDINFCLAQIDPDGNPTDGVIYHEDQDALINEGDLFQHAWDNYKYLNIYFPKYTGGAPSDFTAYAYYPSNFGSSENLGGVFYSSIRWGYGNHSILEEGDDWASVCSHEVGHWLNLRHTFQSGCSGSGDFVTDTPRTEGGTIEQEGCNNNDFSCGEHTNGSNFMDYNHRCKKMFTLGQIARMEAALQLSSRAPLWSPENLIETGCSDALSSVNQLAAELGVKIYPNPATDYINITTESVGYNLKIYNSHGLLLCNFKNQSKQESISLKDFDKGVYLLSVSTEQGSLVKKFIVI